MSGRRSPPRAGTENLVASAVIMRGGRVASAEFQCRSNRFRLTTQPATGTARSRHTRSIGKDRSSIGLSTDSRVPVSCFGFAVGTGPVMLGKFDAADGWRCLTWIRLDKMPPGLKAGAACYQKVGIVRWLCASMNARVPLVKSRPSRWATSRILAAMFSETSRAHPSSAFSATTRMGRSY
jgi:hypothetical protein